MKKKLAWGGYLLALHLLLALSIVRSHTLDNLAVAAGLRASDSQKFIESMRRSQAMQDPAVPAGAVIFLGDSNMQALPVAAVSPVGVNYGIGWQRSDELLESMDAYASLSRASAVVVMIGTNDYLQRREGGLAERYRAILAKIPPMVTVILSSTPPLASADMRRAAQEAHSACSARPRCVSVDLFEALSGNPGALRDDGIHLSPAGYAVWVQLLRHALTGPAAR